MTTTAERPKGVATAVEGYERENKRRHRQHHIQTAKDALFRLEDRCLRDGEPYPNQLHRIRRQLSNLMIEI